MLIITCPFSGRIETSYAVAGLHRVQSSYPMLQMSLAQLDKIAKQEQPAPTQHLLLVAYLLKCNAIFSAPLKQDCIDSYTMADLLPRVSKAAYKFSGPVAAAYPRLHISIETTGIDISAWLESVEAINSTKRSADEDPEVAELISYIWSCKAQRAGAAWLESILAKSELQQWQTAEIIAVCSHPARYEPRAIKAVQQLLQEHVHPNCEQDALNLQRTINKIAKERYAKLGFNALFDDPDFNLAEELESERASVGFELNDMLEQTIRSVRANNKPAEIAEPIRSAYGSEFAYKMALVQYQMQQRRLAACGK